jgi:hypothetical protein
MCHLLELRRYPYDGHLLARPVSIKDLPTRLDGWWTGDLYPSHDRTTVRPYPYYGTVRTPTMQQGTLKNLSCLSRPALNAVVVDKVESACSGQA